MSDREKDIISLQNDRDDTQSFVRYTEDRKRQALRLHRWRTDKRPRIAKHPAFGYNEETGKLEYYDVKNRQWVEIGATQTTTTSTTSTPISTRYLMATDSIATNNGINTGKRVPFAYSGSILSFAGLLESPAVFADNIDAYIKINDIIQSQTTINFIQGDRYKFINFNSGDLTFNAGDNIIVENQSFQNSFTLYTTIIFEINV